MLELFEHGEREVVEKVFLVCFHLISLMKSQVSSLNKKGVKAVVLGPERSDTETKDVFEGKYTTLCLQSRCAFKWVLNTDRGFKAASWTEEIKNGNVQHYFEV